MTPDCFQRMGSGKHCAETLLTYVKNMKRILELEEMFSNHFEVLVPYWLTRILKLRTTFEEEDIIMRSAEHTEQRLHDKEIEFKRAGIKWGGTSRSLKEESRSSG